MKQVLNIFRKDTRQYWLEIALSVTVVFAFALVCPNQWRVFHDPSVQSRMTVIVVALGILMVTGWWLLIARAGSRGEPGGRPAVLDNATV